MKGRMQKNLSEVKCCPQKARTESEGYVGAQTFMWICEDNIVEVPFDKEHLLSASSVPITCSPPTRRFSATRAVAVSTRCLVSKCSLGSWLTRML